MIDQLIGARSAFALMYFLVNVNTSVATKVKIAT